MATSAIGGAIDVNGIVSQLMSIERQPLQVLQKSISGIQTKLSAFGKLQGQLSSFQDAARDLLDLDTWKAAQASTSDETAVKASASAGALPGAYDLTITQLAQRQTLATGAFANAGVVMGEGTLRIQLGTYTATGNTFTANPDKPEVAVSIAAGSTLAQVRDAINAADANVSASIVTDAGGARLVLRSDATGLSNSIKMTVTDADTTDTDTSGLSRLAYDPTAAVGAGKNLTQTQAAQNAQLSVSGIAVTSESNTVEGVVENVTLDLRKAGTGTLSVNVSYDGAQMRKAVEKFVSTWNDLNKTLADQTKFDPDSKVAGPLQGNNTVLGLQRQLRNTLQGVLGSGSPSRLSEAGIELQRNGSLSIKASRFDALLATPDKLKNLFAATDADPSLGGIARRLDTLVTGILGSDGAITSATENLRARQTRIEDQQDRLEQRLTLVEQRLVRQYTALDTNMSALNGASSFLTAKFG